MSEEKKQDILGKEEELDMDELEKVAGGYSSCLCPIGGNGEEDDLFARMHAREEMECYCGLGGVAN